MQFGRLRSVEDLWGFCRSCYYADICRGGCTWTTHSLLGRPGNNPYCHYRVTELAKRGLRERIAKKTGALPTPFAVGVFELLQEAIPGAECAVRASETEPMPPRTEQVAPARPSALAGEGRVPPTLSLCPSCYQFAWPEERQCPFCGVDTASALAGDEAERNRRRELMAEVEALLTVERPSE